MTQPAEEATVIRLVPERTVVRGAVTARRNFDGLVIIKASAGWTEDDWNAAAESVGLQFDRDPAYWDFFTDEPTDTEVWVIAP